MTDYTTKEDEEFFAAIGRLTISWAQIELGLDCTVNIIHQFLNGKTIDPKAPRTSLYRKTRYIRKWIKTLPESITTGAAIFVEAAPRLMDQIDAAAEKRHDLIHGVVIKHEEGSGEADMARLIHSATKPIERKYFTVTTTQILQQAVDAGKLGHRSLFLGTELQNMIIALANQEKGARGEPES